ncbi:nucleotide-diphospho-sugar transferase [Spirosoma fluminis]
MFTTPVLLLMFNRPSITQQTFNRIRQIQPRHLFVAADGPRPNQPADAELCQKTRAIIETQIDWDCELQTLFRTENRSCGRGPAEAITWFFTHVDAGIVLEDDCLPELSFFGFCQQLLERYAADPRVYMITGTNAMKRWFPSRQSYFFSYMGHSLGWASWRRAWQAFDYELNGADTLPVQNQIRTTLANDQHANHYVAQFMTYQKTQPSDVWDFQWLFSRWANGGCTIVPSVNLISNIGFTAEATHSFNEDDLLANLPVFPISFPLTDAAVKIDRLFDWVVFERFVNPAKRPLWKKLLLKSIRLLAT